MLRSHPVGGPGYPNAIAAQCSEQLFFQTYVRRCGVVKSRRDDILHFRTDAQKLILGSLESRDPLDHLSVIKLVIPIIKTMLGPNKLYENPYMHM